ncbi:MAG: exonuclease domain-containing protein [Oscillospiraceae bacterium]|nr:exonuclease domain-containing protein [Oscillospiraceae bacterium]
MAVLYDAHIFLDFEMNPIPREFQAERRICRNEIIEIGAVKLDQDYQITDRYAQYVKPQYGGISPRITSLTGITDQAVAQAPGFEVAMEQFAQWIGEGRARIYSWSMSDPHQLWDESWLKEIPLPWQLNQRWMDFQAVYTRLIGLSGRQPLSLKNAVGSANYRFDGEAHRAVHDAENAASLLVLVQEGRLKEQADAVWSMLHPDDAPHARLGDTYGDQLQALLDQMRDGEF